MVLELDKEFLSPSFNTPFSIASLNECSFNHQQDNYTQLNFQDKALLTFLQKGEITEDSCDEELDEIIKPPFKID